jgi:Beta/Gamma crystallin
VTPQPGDIPQIVAFDNDGLLGDHIHLFGNVPDLGKWGNSISSVVILAGRWEFFDGENFQGTKMTELGPGTYLRVQDHGMKDNSISSIRLVSPMRR